MSTNQQNVYPGHEKPQSGMGKQSLGLGLGLNAIRRNNPNEQTENSGGGSSSSKAHLESNEAMVSSNSENEHEQEYKQEHEEEVPQQQVDAQVNEHVIEQLQEQGNGDGKGNGKGKSDADYLHLDEQTSQDLKLYYEWREEVLHEKQKSELPFFICTKQPVETFYKDEGGKSNHMIFRVYLKEGGTGKGKHDDASASASDKSKTGKTGKTGNAGKSDTIPQELRRLAEDSGEGRFVPLSVSLLYENGLEVDARDVKAVLNVLGCSEDISQDPYLDLESGFGGVAFRYEKVSRHLDDAKLVLRVSVEGLPRESALYKRLCIESVPTLTLSKRKHADQRVREQALEGEREAEMERRRVNLEKIVGEPVPDLKFPPSSQNGAIRGTETINDNTIAPANSQVSADISVPGSGFGNNSTTSSIRKNPQRSGRGQSTNYVESENEIDEEDEGGERAAMNDGEEEEEEEEEEDDEEEGDGDGDGDGENGEQGAGNEGDIGDSNELHGAKGRIASGRGKKRDGAKGGSRSRGAGSRSKNRSKNSNSNRNKGGKGNNRSRRTNGRRPSRAGYGNEEDGPSGRVENEDENDMDEDEDEDEDNGVGENANAIGAVAPNDEGLNNDENDDDMDSENLDSTSVRSRTSGGTATANITSSSSSTKRKKRSHVDKPSAKVSRRATASDVPAKRGRPAPGSQRTSGASVNISNAGMNNANSSRYSGNHGGSRPSSRQPSPVNIMNLDDRNSSLQEQIDGLKEAVNNLLRRVHSQGNRIRDLMQQRRSVPYGGPSNSFPFLRSRSDEAKPNFLDAGKSGNNAPGIDYIGMESQGYGHGHGQGQGQGMMMAKPERLQRLQSQEDPGMQRNHSSSYLPFSRQWSSGSQGSQPNLSSQPSLFSGRNMSGFPITPSASPPPGVTLSRQSSIDPARNQQQVQAAAQQQQQQQQQHQLQQLQQQQLQQQQLQQQQQQQQQLGQYQAAQLPPHVLQQPVQQPVAHQQQQQQQQPVQLQSPPQSQAQQQPLQQRTLAQTQPPVSNESSPIQGHSRMIQKNNAVEELANVAASRGSSPVPQEHGLQPQAQGQLQTGTVNANVNSIPDDVRANANADANVNISANPSPSAASPESASRDNASSSPGPPPPPPVAAGGAGGGGIADDGQGNVPNESSSVPVPVPGNAPHPGNRERRNSSIFEGEEVDV